MLHPISTSASTSSSSNQLGSISSKHRYLLSRQAATGPISTSSSLTYAPLTTIFTPDPSCSSTYYIPCNSICEGEVFPWDPCSRIGIGSCYPPPGTNNVDNTFTPTYSPGYFCPVGMTTVTSVFHSNSV
ncbi:hypothetical protein F4678DRAFT_431317 [Xylaria arbuscula]|nr:hypothetical protein F4678DRAFT_431317 [Xylaria arbuscula]